MAVSSGARVISARLKCGILLVVGILVYTVEAGDGLVVSEVLKDPRGREDTIPGGKSHEFVELTAIGADTVDLEGLLLSDGRVVDSVVHWEEPPLSHDDCVIDARFLPPGASAVILDRDYARAPPTSRLPLEPGCIVLTVDHVSLLGGISSGDGFFVYRGTSERIDNVVCSFADAGELLQLDGDRVAHTPPANAPEGYSLVPSSLLFGPVSYTVSADSLSPGRLPLIRDNWILEWRLGTVDTEDSTAACSLAVRVVGPAPPAASWLVRSRSGESGAALRLTENTARFSVTLPLDSAGYEACIEDGEARVCRDIDLSEVWVPPGAVKITEIFPRADTEMPEWFEVTNTSAMNIDLKNWTFGNSEGRDTLSTSDFSLKPGGFLVVTRNKSDMSASLVSVKEVLQPRHWHALDNYNDTLCLWDAHGAGRERAAYDHTWFSTWDAGSIQRVSLKREGASPEAWAARGSSTPGLPNTDAVLADVSRPAMHIGPIPFTPDGDGRNDSLAIVLQFPPSATATLSVIGFDGTTLVEFPDCTGEPITWDGVMEDNRPAPVGPFFVIADVRHGSSRTLLRKKGIVWR